MSISMNERAASLVDALAADADALGIEVAFSREGQSGNRVIRIRMGAENTVSTVSTVSSVRHNDGPCQPAAGAAGDERHRAAATAAADADGADGADAKSAVHFG